ncbi:prephenate dehydrogenase [Clostridiaceae bacterium HSG29]|nr:prephenate dehydrogenase [Clostridiaceae bacterium HSG29]
MDDFKIAVVGLGLIGGSIALKLKDLGFKNVFGVDIDKETLKKALKKGIIDIGKDESLKVADIVIVCLYPKDAINFIKENIMLFKKNAFITDVSGVKNNISKEMEGLLSNDKLFIPGHPMAGREKGGFDSAIIDLFEGANYLLVNNEKIIDQRLENFKEIIKKLGAKAIEVDEKTHDKMIALTSQVPHIIASILTRVNTFEDTKNYVGNSFDEMTRISLMNEKLWSELFINNKDYLKNFLNDIVKEINEITNMLENSDKDSIEKMLLNTRVQREEYLNS